MLLLLIIYMYSLENGLLYVHHVLCVPVCHRDPHLTVTHPEKRQDMTVRLWKIVLS